MSDRPGARGAEDPRASAPLLFITGASSGIGQAMALEWARRGGRLALVARREAEMRAWCAAEGLGPERAQVYAADVRDVPAMTAAGRACIAAQGLPDVVIANAGISVGVDTAIESELDVIRATLETNNLGMAATFQPFVEPMRVRRRGTLVGIASVASVRGLPGHAAYCLSKAGVVAYCESLRGECRPSGVRVVTIVPGYIDTPLTQGNPYRMPFLAAPEFAARKMAGAISRRQRFYVVPWQMGWLGIAMKLAPRPLYDRVVANRGRKPRRSD